MAISDKRRIAFPIGSSRAQFISSRFGSLMQFPHGCANQWECERDAWLKVHPESWSCEVELEYHQRFSGAIEHWLDAGHGSCLLRQPKCAEIVAETLRHFEGERVVIISAVVMPNHVHALCAEFGMAYGKTNSQLERIFGAAN